MIVRHGEKPTNELAGVHPNGDQSENCLIPRRWQRAGALVPLFANPTNLKVKTPTLLIAANREAPGADPKEKSLREEQTLSALSGALKTKAEELPHAHHCHQGRTQQHAALSTTPKSQTANEVIQANVQLLI